MNEIRAFVGHSFTKDDEIVVQTFLKYFGQVENLHSSFNWTHAKAAEPTELARKVLNLVEGCNVFIGICTRKEFVSQDTSYRSGLLNREKLTINSNDLSWKTSDWIIQEFGMAASRGMSIVCLLENGCRTPGGLQGNLEFIPFDREAPEKCFGQLLEMIQALSPTVKSSETVKTEGSQDVAKEEPKSDQALEFDDPHASWDLKKYEDAFIDRLLRADADSIRDIETAYLQTPEANDQDKAIGWQAWTEAWRIHLGKEGSLDRLIELSQQHPKNVKVLEELAEVLSKFKDHSKAAAKYRLAAENSTNDFAEEQRLLRNEALEYARAGMPNQADSILNKQIVNVDSNPDMELPLLSALRKIAEINKDEHLQIEAMERTVKVKPDDYEIRFSLAYLHSQKGNSDVAFYHYLQIPWQERSPMTWNNLGVSFDEFSMPAAAIHAYRKSASQGETLAMANLGYKLMQAGFVDEANKELEKALKIEDFHRNVGRAIADLKYISEKETEEENKTLAKAKEKIDFYQKLGAAIVEPQLDNITKEWRSPLCDLSICIAKDTFTATGQYERKSSGLGSGLLASKTTQHKIDYSGTIRGHRVCGSIKRTSLDENASPTTSALGLSDNETSFMMIVTEDKISVMENPYLQSPSFYEVVKR